MNHSFIFYSCKPRQLTEPSFAAFRRYLVISHEISTAGAFFFVTLFNLQGARRSAERCYYTGSSGRLSSLFSTFFADHFRSCETARLDYHIFMPFVKYFFQSLNFPLTSPRPLSRTASLEYQPFPFLSTLFVPLFSLLLIFPINHPYIGGASGQFYNTRQKNGPSAENRAGAASLIYPISRG